MFFIAKYDISKYMYRHCVDVTFGFQISRIFEKCLSLWHHSVSITWSALVVFNHTNACGLEMERCIALRQARPLGKLLSMTMELSSYCHALHANTNDFFFVYVYSFRKKQIYKNITDIHLKQTCLVNWNDRDSVIENIFFYLSWWSSGLHVTRWSHAVMRFGFAGRTFNSG